MFTTKTEEKPVVDFPLLRLLGSIAVSGDDIAYVCDCGNRRLQLFRLGQQKCSIFFSSTGTARIVNKNDYSHCRCDTGGILERTYARSTEQQNINTYVL